eukprot:3082137-Amphidinium_carterae.1
MPDARAPALRTPPFPGKEPHSNGVAIKAHGHKKEATGSQDRFGSSPSLQDEQSLEVVHGTVLLIVPRKGSLVRALLQQQQSLRALSAPPSHKASTELQLHGMVEL